MSVEYHFAPNFPFSCHFSPLHAFTLNYIKRLYSD